MLDCVSKAFFSHLIALTIALLVNGQTPAHAQDVTPSAQAEGLDQTVIDGRRANLERVIARAEAVAERGSSEYYSVLRQGLSLLAAQVLDPTALDRLEPQIVPGLDDDAAVRSSIDHAVSMTMAALSTPAPQTRTNLDDAWPRERMVGPGARPMRAGDFTQTVAITDFQQNQACTGTVIALGAVLTAAHCACAFKLLPGEAGIGHVEFGNPSLIVPFRPPARIRNDGTALFDPQFCEKLARGEKICSPDIAVLRYEHRSDLEYIQIAWLPSDDDVERSLQGSFPEVVGYGQADVPGATTNGIRTLQRENLKLKLVARIPRLKSCQSTTCTTSVHGCVGGHDVILSDQGGNDSCGGDSGGPAFLAGPFTTNPKLMAVTSRALQSDGACGPGGIYVKVYTPTVRQWLCGIQGLREHLKVCNE